MQDEYLGDGVYASCDGYHIWLDLRGQDSTTKIALEPLVLRALFDYWERMKRKPEGDPEIVRTIHDHF